MITAVICLLPIKCVYFNQYNDYKQFIKQQLVLQNNNNNNKNNGINNVLVKIFLTLEWNIFYVSKKDGKGDATEFEEYMRVRLENGGTAPTQRHSNARFNTNTKCNDT